MPWRHMGERRYSSSILVLGIRWRLVASFTPLPIYTRGKSPQYPFDRRLGGPQSRSGQYGENRTQAVQPVARSPKLYRLSYPDSPKSPTLVILNQMNPCLIWGSFSGDHEEYCLQGCDAVKSGRIDRRFWRTYCLHLQDLRVSQASNETASRPLCFLIAFRHTKVFDFRTRRVTTRKRRFGRLK
jgi:hypothetical protein